MASPHQASRCELTCIGQGEGGEALRPVLSAMRSGCEPSASVRGLSLDGSDPSFSLGFGVWGSRVAVGPSLISVPPNSSTPQK